MSDAGAALIQALENDLNALLRDAVRSRLALEEAERGRVTFERKLLLGLLDLRDALDRVFHSVQSRPDSVNEQMRVWLGNFRAVGRLLDRQLGDLGAERMPVSPGDSFDPERHSILETVADPSKDDETIVEEVGSGWVRAGAVLRKATVAVVLNDDREA